MNFRAFNSLLQPLNTVTIRHAFPKNYRSNVFLKNILHLSPTGGQDTQVDEALFIL